MRPTPATARFALGGRVALVTGASQGIGRAAARRLVEEGAAVCAVAAPADRADLEEAVEELVGLGGRAVGLAGDVAEPVTAEQAVELAVRSFGRLDYLLSNAGIFAREDPLEAAVDQLDRLLAVNVRGNYLMSARAARAMAGQGGGAIVITASTAALLGDESMAAYNASKAAAAQLARSLAVDLAPRNVRVNAVAPGWVDTPQNVDVRDDPVAWGAHRLRVPMDRMARPEEVAAAMVFLLSDEASYITGAILMVDGGLTAGLRSPFPRADPGGAG
jgi:NAD(P)-dependent dehydrogenase (short-subunit alcohol dehydrogenase family)